MDFFQISIYFSSFLNLSMLQNVWTIVKNLLSYFYFNILKRFLTLLEKLMSRNQCLTLLLKVPRNWITMY